MGEEDEREACFCALNLPFLHIPAAAASMGMESPSTPPLQTSASVPFKWEEQPGKPRPCSHIIPPTLPPKTLDLPPCKFTKTPSPTTVFDGPYTLGRPKFSSFRLFSSRDLHHNSSFNTFTPDPMDFLLLPPAANNTPAGAKTRRFFGKFKKDFDGGSCRFSPSSISSFDSEEESSCGRVKLQRNGSSHARSSHLWTTIYQGIKQVMQWKSNKKSNKQGRQ